MKSRMKSALIYAYPKTIPVMVGYLFLGTAYGILMNVNGYGLGWAAAMSIFVYAGSMQYMAIGLLVSTVGPLQGFLMTLMINARHLFYGISMLNSYKEVKKFKPYLIFALTDETFSILCNEREIKGVDKDWVYFWICLLDQLYWLAGTVLGAILGSLISFNTKGLDFALTALFVVIFVDQWKSQENHRPALTGLAASVFCLTLWGSKAFIIPAMCLILLILPFQYKKKEGETI